MATDFVQKTRCMRSALLEESLFHLCYSRPVLGKSK